MISFLERNILGIMTVTFSGGVFIMMIKMTIKDFGMLKKDYYDFKEDLIDRLARIETALGIKPKPKP